MSIAKINLDQFYFILFHYCTEKKLLNLNKYVISTIQITILCQTSNIYNLVTFINK